MKIETLNQQEIFPITIDTEYPYLAIGDIQATVKRIAPKLNGPIVKGLQDSLFSILEAMSPPETSFFSVLFSEIDQQINQRLEQILTQNRNTAIIIMDRYLSPPRQENVFKLEVSRKATGGLIARPGTTISPENQIQNLASWILETKPSEIVLTDDVLAFADTSIPIIQLIQDILPNTKIKLLTGIASSQEAWSGIEKVKEQTGVDTESIIIVKASPETNWTLGMALPTSRDFTIFGGKINSLPDYPFPVSLPYFLPFCIPQASFVMNQDILLSSQALLEYNRLLIEAVNQSLGRPITIADLVNSGFGVPTTNLQSLSEIYELPKPETTLTEYLQYCQQLLESNTSSIINEITTTRQ
jgi:hypothetical protein